MTELAWAEVRQWFDPDPLSNGYLPDLEIVDTRRADWQTILDLVRTHGWQSEFAVDGVIQALPECAHGLFERPAGTSGLLRVWPVPDIQVNFWAFSVDRIDSDVDLRELQGQERLDILCGFLRTVGAALGKRVVMRAEGDSAPAEELLAYQPHDDRIVWLAPPWDESP